MILPFVSVYTKKYTDIPYVDVKLAVLFMLIGFANNIRIPCLTMINAAGHFKETQWRAILEAVINITVSLLLIKPLGMDAERPEVPLPHFEAARCAAAG